MAVVKVKLSFALLLLLKSIAGFRTNFDQDEGIFDMVDCANQIMMKYYKKGSEVTFIDMSNGSYENNYILTELHRRLHASIVSRSAEEQLVIQNEGYIIFVKTVDTFVSQFSCLTREAAWNPEGKFTIVLDSDENELKAVFEILLKYHVFNVVIINGIYDLNLYTYNPFEDYGCGKNFNRIINYGKCSNSTKINLFPNKLVTGFRNCTLNVAAPHWPPYIIKPSANSKTMGIEQSIFKIFSEREHFKSNYTYTNDAETFTLITQAMSAVGPLVLLQNNKADAIFGGMMLIKSRADVFDYICSHLAFVDEIKLLVKKARIVPAWKTLYLEFKPLVWMLIIISFLVYFLFLILIGRGDDKTSVLLKMWDSLFAHGHTIYGSRPVKCAFIVWIWFAYLVNSFYQSNLFRLSTNPAKDYQISNDQDLVNYNMKPCISNVLQTLMWAVLEIPMVNSTDNCEPLLRSIQTVTEDDKVYTITVYSILSYNRHKFVDEYGNSYLHEFPTLNKIMYAMYFYKGFPLLDKLHTYALRLRENGLIEKISKDLDYEESIKHYYSKAPLIMHVTVPWLIYFVGVSSATFVFVIEMTRARRQRGLLKL